MSQTYTRKGVTANQIMQHCFPTFFRNKGPDCQHLIKIGMGTIQCSIETCPHGMPKATPNPPTQQTTNPKSNLQQYKK